MSRESGLTRRTPGRAARPRLLVVCGSERTEPQYLIGLRDSLDNRAVDIQLARCPRSPAQVVAYAQRLLATRSDFDEAWCVFDADGIDHVRNPSTSVWRLVEKIIG